MLLQLVRDRGILWGMADVTTPGYTNSCILAVSTQTMCASHLAKLKVGEHGLP